MNLLHLQYFYFVAKESGFTRAAEALRVRQPAVSRMVALLEGDLGFKLFERRGREVRLTQRGERVFERARRIFGEVDALRLALGQISGECAGDLQLAAAEPIAAVLVPRALAPLLARHPKIYPQLTSGPASFLLEKLRGGAVELGLFFHIPDLKEGLAVTEKLPLRFHLVVRRKQRADRAVLARFIGSREIDDTTTRRFPTLERWRRVCPEAAIHVSTNNLSAHKALVLLGLGIAVLPSFMVAEELARGTLVDLLPREKLVFALKVVARETSVPSLNAREFLRALRACV